MWIFEKTVCLSFIFLFGLFSSFSESECWRIVRVCADCSGFRWRYKQAAELRLWRLQTKGVCGSRGGPRRAQLAAAPDVVMLLFSCLRDAHKQTGCARLRAVARSGRCITRGTSFCRKEAGRWGWRAKHGSRAPGSLTPPWTRDLTFRPLPINSALVRTRTVLRWRVRRIKPGTVKKKS